MANEYETQYLQLLIGQLQGRVGALEENGRQQTELMREMAKELSDVNRTLNNATGGWRTLVGIGTAGATIGGLLVAIFKGA